MLKETEGLKFSFEWEKDKKGEILSSVAVQSKQMQDNFVRYFDIVYLNTTT